MWKEGQKSESTHKLPVPLGWSVPKSLRGRVSSQGCPLYDVGMTSKPNGWCMLKECIGHYDGLTYPCSSRDSHTSTRHTSHLQRLWLLGGLSHCTTCWALVGCRNSHLIIRWHFHALEPANPLAPCICHLGLSLWRLGYVVAVEEAQWKLSIITYRCFLAAWAPFCLII